MKTESEILCKGGCGSLPPSEDYDVETHMATWFGRYNGCILIEWICRSCWDKGVRYTGSKNKNES